jgi:hypothetical protein
MKKKKNFYKNGKRILPYRSFKRNSANKLKEDLESLNILKKYKKDEDEDKDKNVDGIKYISLLNENIGDGINNFDSILESTKNAGEEINYSFQQLSENLEKFSQNLNARNNNH